MSPLFKKSEEEVAIVLDLANDSIGGALVKLSCHGTPEILYAVRDRIDLSHAIDAEKLTFLMTRHLKKVCDALEKEGIRHLHFPKHLRARIRSVYCIFSSPWYLSQTKTVTVKKDREFSVTKHLIDSLIDEEEKKFESSVSEGTYGDLFNDDVVMIERKIIHTKLNGYETITPFDKTAHSVQVAFLTTLVSKNIVKAVKDIVQKYFSVHSFMCNSSSLVTFSTVRDFYPDIGDFVISDITGEITEMSVARGGVVQETVSFPLGTSHLIRAVTEGLKMSPELAQSLINTYQSGHIESASGKKIADILKTFEADWRGMFTRSVAGLPGGAPKQVFITTPEAFAQFFVNAVQKESLGSERAVGGNAYTATALTSSILGHSLALLPKVRKDTSLMIDGIFINKLCSLAHE